MVATPPTPDKTRVRDEAAWRADIASSLDRFRARKPHIHCITNIVAQAFTANVLLAAGATPSMTVNPAEIETFAGFADAVLINLGTMDDERLVACERAVATCQRAGKPWALDPVFVQASPIRQSVALDMLLSNPTLVRANSAECAVLGDGLKYQTQVLAITGKVDRLERAGQVISLENGAPVMDRVTAMGCALTALAIGFCAFEEDALLGSTAALALFGVAGQRAAALSGGPGSFVPNFLDALHTLTPEQLAQDVRIVL
ncbi:MAG: hydroxyethylthiazole kinase [Pseudomonadota bacterium]